MAEDAEDTDIEGLLEGLEGQARTERAELVDWLLGQGYTVEQIRGAVSPMLLPAGRVVGDDLTLAQDHDAVRDREHVG